MAASASHSEAHAYSDGSGEVHPTVRAKHAIAACQAKYAKVKDYTCLFIKRDGNFEATNHTRAALVPDAAIDGAAFDGFDSTDAPLGRGIRKIGEK